ncbi:hypothetical protein CAEBREN_05461 [Caenorhabditis brenneri]|uniref:Uncharacterized protein n=1 Tax=Caenorhabditis brenneri TaxID=135651 RepID=G0NV37_CAEBE|nr:hypothetical protein CAEBREN_05461 [Caenorhabditis brenneri]
MVSTYSFYVDEIQQPLFFQIVLPGCTLHTEIARKLNHMVTHDQRKTVMMEFDAKLCPGDYEDRGNGFNGTVEIDVDNHKEDWNAESEKVCEAEITQQSFFF